MSEVLVFPASFQTVKNYGGYDGWDIWLKAFPNELPAADYYVGHSGGAHFILARLGSIQKGKLIFINPQIRKRNLLSLFISWMEFFFSEGIKWEKITPIRSWPFGFKRLFEVLKVDVFGIMSKIPKENLVIIKGKNDNYFCDKESAEILKNNGFEVVEVEAGHDWNENIAEAVASYIR
jgi:hypothetical protein